MNLIGLCPTTTTFVPMRTSSKRISPSGLLHKGQDLSEVGFVLSGTELFFSEATGAFAPTLISRSSQGVERNAPQC